MWKIKTNRTMDIMKEIDKMFVRILKSGIYSLLFCFVFLFHKINGVFR